MRSVSSALILLGAVGLSGCVTTQDINKRLDARSQRTLDGRLPLKIGAPSPDVSVGDVTLLRGGHGTAVVASLRNTTTRTLTDLPVAVGVGKDAPLNANRKGRLDFYDTHVAMIPPGQTVRWVFTTEAKVAKNAKPYATVGAAATPHPTTLPTMTVKADQLTGSGDPLTVHVANPTSVPQYDMPVYAFALRGERVVAAGRTTVNVGIHTGHDYKLSLLGDASKATLSLHAFPTIYK